MAPPPGVTTGLGPVTHDFAPNPAHPPRRDPDRRSPPPGVMTGLSPVTHDFATNPLHPRVTTDVTSRATPSPQNST
ncbi:hypothetical protein [Rhodopila sp.]|uniref:hypothetical protein n=1 Tax=Rhodopila sp. TaxID=2480087 RepID=UPI003D09EAE3